MAAARVLVVDDEPQILIVLSYALKRAGHEVLSTTSPTEALKITETPVDLVISDVAMPEMRGPELVEEIRRRSPQTAAIFMSGCTGSSTLPPDVPFLQKPFSLPELIRTVDALLSKCAKARMVLAQAREESEETRIESLEIRAESQELRRKVALNLSRSQEFLARVRDQKPTGGPP